MIPRAAQVARLRAVLSVSGEDDTSGKRDVTTRLCRTEVASESVERRASARSARLILPTPVSVPSTARLVGEAGGIDDRPVDVGAPFVSLLGDTFAADPSGFARMLGDILLDGLVIDSVEDPVE